MCTLGLNPWLWNVWLIAKLGLVAHHLFQYDVSIQVLWEVGNVETLLVFVFHSFMMWNVLHCLILF